MTAEDIAVLTSKPEAQSQVLGCSVFANRSYSAADMLHASVTTTALPACFARIVNAI